MVYLVTLDTVIAILQTKGYSPVITDDKDRLTSSQIYQNENENVVQSKRS
jgi:hypothetical protein